MLVFRSMCWYQGWASAPPHPRRSPYDVSITQFKCEEGTVCFNAWSHVLQGVQKLKSGGGKARAYPQLKSEALIEEADYPDISVP